MNARIDASLLPPSLADLVDVIGLAGVLKLVEAYPGVRCYVPFDFAIDHPLARAVGPDIARKLIAFMPGEQVKIPKCEAAIRAVRNREIRRRHAAGETVASLAIEFGLGESQTWAICAEDDTPSAQCDMFAP